MIEVVIDLIKFLSVRRRQKWLDTALSSSLLCRQVLKTRCDLVSAQRSISKLPSGCTILVLSKLFIGECLECLCSIHTEGANLQCLTTLLLIYLFYLLLIDQLLTSQCDAVILCELFAMHDS